MLVDDVLILTVTLPLFVAISPFTNNNSLVALVCLLTLFHFFFTLSKLSAKDPFTKINTDHRLALNVLIRPVLVLSLLMLTLVTNSARVRVVDGALTAN